MASHSRGENLFCLSHSTIYLEYWSPGDDANVASAIVIERCGGVLESIKRDSEGYLFRRYWIA